MRIDRDVFKSTAVTRHDEPIDTAACFVMGHLLYIYSGILMYSFCWVPSRDSLWTSTTTLTCTPFPSRNRPRCTTTKTMTRLLECVFKVSPYSIYGRPLPDNLSIGVLCFLSKEHSMFCETHYGHAVA